MVNIWTVWLVGSLVVLLSSIEIQLTDYAVWPLFERVTFSWSLSSMRLWSKRLYHHVHNEPVLLPELPEDILISYLPNFNFDMVFAWDFCVVNLFHWGLPIIILEQFLILPLDVILPQLTLPCEITQWSSGKSSQFLWVLWSVYLHRLLSWIMGIRFWFPWSLGIHAFQHINLIHEAWNFGTYVAEATLHALCIYRCPVCIFSFY
jgi:hypothetical protein